MNLIILRVEFDIEINFYIADNVNRKVSAYRISKINERFEVKMKTRAKIGILIMGVLAMSQLAIATAIQPITQAFPNVSIATVQMLGSLPSIGGIIAALLITPLSVHISNKWLAEFGVIMVCLGGLMPLALHTNIYFLLFCAALLGIGQSFITTMIPTLLSEYFNDDEKQGLLGINQGMSSLGALFLSGLSGILISHGWVNVYYLYLLAVIVLIISIWLVPNDHPAGQIPKQETNKPSSAKLPTKVYVIAFSSFLVTLVYTAFANNIGIYIANEKIGSSAITGLVIAMGTVGGLIAGLGAGKLFKVLKTRILSVAALLIGIAFIVIFFVHNEPILFISSFFAGASMSMYMARAAFLMTNEPSPVLIPRAMAWFTFGNSLGGLISPLFFKMLGFSAGIASLNCAGIISIILAVALILTHFEKKASVISAKI